ncbi:GTP pyrophosphokinase [Balneicella halophila]|uniref:GTP pyrophosphokinase n=1 Tax=Balneicella halophila TaxID=1537566 RepID=A0A7L4UPG2_BALHA|nr:HD domain-containing protein [Balneicella halophila]PVX51015.1 GTP pyrophosphokinase [Balneicella halophila]
MEWREELHKIIIANSKGSTSTDEKLLRKTLALLQELTDDEQEGKALKLAVSVTTELGLGSTSAIVSILYELLYIGKFSKEEIKNHYPDSVYRLILGLGKVEELYQVHKENAEIFQKLLLSLAEDVRVILIILARRLYALRHIEKQDKEEQQNLVDEITFVYLPFAHRLGLYPVKMDMEDRLLQFNEPEAYAKLVAELEESEAERLQFIESFIAPIKERLDREGLRYTVKYRTKSIASILGKIRKQQVSLKEVYDIFAIRIILDTPREKEKMHCWQVYSIVSDIYQPNPKRLRDWITIPKSTGYESLHTTVMTKDKRWVEVQIRTERMDEVAEKGFAAHWRYKGGKDNTVLDEWLLNVREILESEGKEGSEEVIDDLLLELSDKEVYIFTPNGDLKQLPRGATVLDFAYSIHGDIGNTCTGGTINNKNVPIRYVLQSGDTVKINTAKNQKPNQDWLQFVVTSKAKSHIRQAMKEQQASEIALGKEMLMRRMKNWDIPFNDIAVRDLQQHFKMKQVHELYYNIGTNKIELNTIKEFFTQKEKEAKEISVEEIKDLQETKKPLGTPSDVLVIGDKVSGVDFTLSSCCSPVFGDDIFGFISISKGIRIHRKNCPNAENMMQRYPYRVVPACWTKQGDTSYMAQLEVHGEDSAGIVNGITALFTDKQSAKLRGISFTTEDGLFIGKLSVEVPNKGYLDMISSKIQTLKGVQKVIRLKK